MITDYLEKDTESMKAYKICARRINNGLMSYGNNSFVRTGINAL